jgi:hypothetical protein
MMFGVRTAAIVTVMALAWATWLATFDRFVPEDPGVIVGLAVPASVLVGERIVVRGVAWFHDEVVLEGRLRLCEAGTHRCLTTSRRTVTGSDWWIGAAGEFIPRRPGAYELDWVLLDTWGKDALRASLRARIAVMVEDGR